MTTNFTGRSPLLDGLEESQLLAATAGPGPVVVMAGPGSGKTRTLTRRAAFLVDEMGLAPEEMLVLTFTNKAAGELAERISGLLGKDRKAPAATTLHSLGASLLISHLGDEWRVVDEEERAALLKGLFPDAGPGMADRISRARQGVERPDEELEELIATYQNKKKKDRVFDFDDLILSPLELLEQGDLNLGSRGLRAVLVDEFQDLNLPQYRLLSHLVPGDGRGLMVIGDPNQAIYSFRGSDPGLFERIKEDYPACETVGLAWSYRVPEAILGPAHSLIRSRGESLCPEVSPRVAGGREPLVAGFFGPRAEAEFVAREIERLVGGLTRTGQEIIGFADGGLGFGDVAILVRLKALAGPLAGALRARGIPFQESGDVPFQETEALDLSAQKVTLMTLHAAKGLEFKAVFVAGVEEGLLPLDIEPYTAPAAEEARLLYVGMTRAKERLYLTYTKDRTVFGRKLPGSPSRFIGHAGLRETGAPGEKKRVKRPRQMGLF